MKHRKFVSDLLVALAILSIAAGLAVPCIRAQEPNRAGLVVDFGDGRVDTYWFEFEGSEINGYDLLLNSGLEVTIGGQAGFGIAVCAIGGVGCPASDCFCQCQGAICIYWSYWHQVDGAWQYSQVGVDSYTAHPGDVDGWAWGKAQEPPLIPLDQICVPTATATHTPTATETPTWTPTPTATAIPATATRTLTATPWPTTTETATATATPVPASVEAPTSTVTRVGTATPSPAAAFTATAEATKIPITHTAVVEPTVVAALPSPTLSATVTTATVTLTPPTPTRLAVATLSSGTAVTADAVSGSQPARAGKVLRSLPSLLAVGTGLAYISFVFFVLLLAALYIVVRLRQR
jgi:hypothetical protein